VPHRTIRSVTIEEVKARFDQWRQSRQGRSRIPDELWAAAGELARQHGVNKISRVLRLEFNHLKRMAESARRVPSAKARKQPAFVELIAPRAGGPAEYSIELEANGRTLRIQCRGASLVELAQLSRALLNSAS